MRSNKIKNSGGAGAIRRWRSINLMALVVGTIGRSIMSTARGDEGPGQVASFRSKFVTGPFVAVDGVPCATAGSASRRPDAAGRSRIGRSAERSDVIA